MDLLLILATTQPRQPVRGPALQPSSKVLMEVLSLGLMALLKEGENVYLLIFFKSGSQDFLAVWEMFE